MLTTRLIHCIILLVCFAINCNGQKEAYVWYFSSRLGLDFNQTPPQILFDGQITFGQRSEICESASSISDKNGNLLFYTDGVTVWTSSHAVMPNGTGLLGHCTTTQTLIVPVPDNHTIFYVFSASPQGDFKDDYLISPKGFYYSVIDMSLNNGMGDVVLKNQQLSNSTTEKITGTHHANGKDIWVVMHEWNNDIFRAYLITKDGLGSNPVISKQGSVHSGGGTIFSTENFGTNAIGQMKFSPDGESLALVLSREKKAEIFKFDKLTGRFNFIDSLTNFDSENVTLYGVEFSPSSRFVYFTDFTRQVIQFDLLTKPISETKVLLANENELFLDNPQAMQLGPDGRIYIAKERFNFVGIIHNPDLKGLACQYESRGIIIEDQPVFWESLPNFISSYFYDPIKYPSSAYFEMPNAFTPNDDGFNDRFLPGANYNIEKSVLRIFNRWGQLVAELNQIADGWSGDQAPSGVYYWEASYSGLNGKQYTKKGIVQLIR